MLPSGRKQPTSPVRYIRTPFSPRSVRNGSSRNTARVFASSFRYPRPTPIPDTQISPFSHRTQIQILVNDVDPQVLYRLSNRDIPSDWRPRHPIVRDVIRGLRRPIGVDHWNRKPLKPAFHQTRTHHLSG